LLGDVADKGNLNFRFNTNFLKTKSNSSAFIISACFGEIFSLNNKAESQTLPIVTMGSSVADPLLESSRKKLQRAINNDAGG